MNILLPFCIFRKLDYKGSMIIIHQDFMETSTLCAFSYVFDLSFYFISWWPRHSRSCLPFLNLDEIVHCEEQNPAFQSGHQIGGGLAILTWGPLWSIGNKKHKRAGQMSASPFFCRLHPGLATFQRGLIC